MIYVIGDVHGCIRELEALVTAVRPGKNDSFVFLGDLVDKGPESLAVVDYVRSLIADYAGSFSVCGNHEEKAIRKREGESWVDKASENQWKWLKSLPLIRFQGPHTFVHGGIFPAYYERFKSAREALILGAEWHRGGGKLGDMSRRFLRLRKVDANGKFVGLDEEKGDQRCWSDVYDGRDGMVFYGHNPRPAVKRSAHAIGLDTGCVVGGSLTAAVVDGVNVVDFVSVPALKKYAEKRFE